MASAKAQPCSAQPCLPQGQCDTSLRSHCNTATHRCEGHLIRQGPVHSKPLPTSEVAQKVCCCTCLGHTIWKRSNPKGFWLCCSAPANKRSWIAMKWPCSLTAAPPTDQKKSILYLPHFKFWSYTCCQLFGRRPTSNNPIRLSAKGSRARTTNCWIFSAKKNGLTQHN